MSLFRMCQRVEDAARFILPRVNNERMFHTHNAYSFHVYKNNRVMHGLLRRATARSLWLPFEKFCRRAPASFTGTFSNALGMPVAAPSVSRDPLNFLQFLGLLTEPRLQDHSPNFSTRAHASITRYSLIKRFVTSVKTIIRPYCYLL
jgi:hypothetical protein